MARRERNLHGEGGAAAMPMAVDVPMQPVVGEALARRLFPSPINVDSTSSSD